MYVIIVESLLKKNLNTIEACFMMMKHLVIEQHYYLAEYQNCWRLVKNRRIFATEVSILNRMKEQLWVHLFDR